MAVDTPARIVIVGAGPIGLEAALYARFLGYDVEVFDRGEVADYVRRWSHVKMFTPFRMNASPLGRAALAAQDDQYRPPDGDAILTGGQWRDRYLLPLSQSDLLVDHLRLQTTVVAVTRNQWLKSERVGDGERAEAGFRILVRARDGREWDTTADIVIDASGVFGVPNWLGQGGAPAIGERSVRDRVEYGIPDVLGADRPRFENRQVLVVGNGHSAATSIVALRTLADSAPATRVTWLTRNPVAGGRDGPLPQIPDDSLAERRGLVEAAHAAVADARGIVSHFPDTRLEAISWDESRGLFDVELSGQHAGRYAFDRVIANVGYRPDPRVFEELQVHVCYATGGPMKLAAHLLANPTADCLQQTAAGPASLLTPEPNFYVLGAKSYGRCSRFLLATGLLQIRDLFTIIGDRESLDLYQGPFP